MSQSVTIKCPNCGAYLEYDPTHGRMTCPYCGTAVDQSDVHTAADTPQQQSQPEQQHTAEASSSGLRSYHCQNCGAEIVTSETTAAARCYFCHSPVVLTDRLTDEFRPDGVIPFKLDRAAAEKKFHQYLDKKRFVDRQFFSAEQMESFSGVYYPYWIGNITGNAEFQGEGTRVNSVTTGRDIITTTRYFQVERAATLRFPGMFRKALQKNDRKLTDGIFPYDTSEIQPFSAAYLSGFLAERRDVTRESAADDMTREAQSAAPSIMSANRSYNSLRGNTVFQATEQDMKYVLLPTWVLTYQGGKDGVPFYFMMNGQTGTVCGRLPVDRKKLLGRAVMIGAAVAAAVCLGGAFVW